jgi:hypothetical protein
LIAILHRHVWQWEPFSPTQYDPTLERQWKGIWSLLQFAEIKKLGSLPGKAGRLEIHGLSVPDCGSTSMKATSNSNRVAHLCLTHHPELHSAPHPHITSSSICGDTQCYSCRQTLNCFPVWRYPESVARPTIVSSYGDLL